VPQEYMVSGQQGKIRIQGFGHGRGRRIAQPDPAFLFSGAVLAHRGSVRVTGKKTSQAAENGGGLEIHELMGWLQA
jgi:hypothetical protein